MPTQVYRLSLFKLGFLERDRVSWSVSVFISVFLSVSLPSLLLYLPPSTLPFLPPSVYTGIYLLISQESGLWIKFFPFSEYTAPLFIFSFIPPPGICLTHTNVFTVRLSWAQRTVSYVDGSALSYCPLFLITQNRCCL